MNTYKNDIFKVELIVDNQVRTFKGDYEIFIKTFCRQPLSYIINQTVGASKQEQKKLLTKIKDLSDKERALAKFNYITSAFLFNHLEIISVEYLRSKPISKVNEDIFDCFLFR